MLIPKPRPLARRRAPLFPDAEERRLREAALALVGEWLKATAAGLRRGLGRDVPDLRIDEDDPLIEDPPVIVIAAIEEAIRAAPGPEAVAVALQRAGVGVDRHVLGEIAEQVAAKAPPPPVPPGTPGALAPVPEPRLQVAAVQIQATEGARARWADEAADLIVRVQDRHRERVAKVIREGWERGWDQARVARELSRVADVTESRARLWARDQIATLNAELTQRRQIEVGITHYRWRTSRDERVRDVHRDREGRLFAWDDPPRQTPDDGHPGRPINCRCTAEPVFADELPSDLEALAPGAGIGPLR